MNITPPCYRIKIGIMPVVCLLLQYASYRYVYYIMLTVSTQQYATVQYKAVCCRSVHRSTRMLQFCTQHYSTRQYTRVCYRPEKSMLQICTQQYATVQYKGVRCRSVNNSKLHVSTQEYATGLTKIML